MSRIAGIHSRSEATHCRRRDRPTLTRRSRRIVCRQSVERTLEATFLNIVLLTQRIQRAGSRPGWRRPRRFRLPPAENPARAGCGACYRSKLGSSASSSIRGCWMAGRSCSFSTVEVTCPSAISRSARTVDVWLHRAPAGAHASRRSRSARTGWESGSGNLQQLHGPWQGITVE